jgi:hypothetical protein
MAGSLAYQLNRDWRLRYFLPRICCSIKLVCVMLFKWRMRFVSPNSCLMRLQRRLTVLYAVRLQQSAKEIGCTSSASGARGSLRRLHLSGLDLTEFSGAVLMLRFCCSDPGDTSGVIWFTSHALSLHLEGRICLNMSRLECYALRNLPVHSQMVSLLHFLIYSSKSHLLMG